MSVNAHSLSQPKQNSGFFSWLWEWLSTVDHKKIAILYLFGGGLFFLIGGIEAMLIRIQLAVPENTFLVGHNYNEVITMHGTTMIFLAAMPFIFALMNAVIPLQIGARDVAFPFVNALGFWLFFMGGIILNLSWFLGGAPAGGWTAYAPLSSEFLGNGMDFYVLGLQVAGAGTLMGAINFLVTIVNMRAPGMTFMRLPLFTWTVFITAVLILFAFPALTVGLFLIFFDRLFDANFFNEANGGNSIIWEHIFWIFGHPEVYILILPAFGVISEVIATFSKKRLFGYSSMVFATILIGFLAFMVWVHHMFTVGLGPSANTIFAIATMAIAVPTGIKIFNWIFTLWGGQITFNTANLYAVGFIPTFVMGGVTGVMLAVPTADFQYHDSYFVVAHFHYVIVGGLIFGLFSGFYYWWPKMFGRHLNETLGKINFWLFFIGFHLTFFFQHFLGLMGMPRRYFTYLKGEGFDAFNMVSTIGAFLMFFAVIVMLINIAYSAVKGEKAKGDAWEQGRTLEWSIASPPPEYNFAQTPLVKGIDAFWKEKMDGKDKMTAAEPVGDIHMPSSSIVPFLMSISLTIASLGFIFSAHDGVRKPALFVAGAGVVLFFLCMLARSIKDDPGFHIHKEEVIETEKGVR
ncbi:cytochrome c oxidase subunit 1 [Scopulibacillus darangshiensis]|uniref:Cytochrome c oxidase subunit 1 n=1 Tax=Scopulibacillus darangshiensis TaxID=442528 RepID=A0A4R2P6H9_9BACL|nr:cytochrome c oxidase subunit I [Scopulibacillus darangshiensis]TCP30500.1 cytochrome c oxidase subunit 1 [Scopulibacillus darangshiensis]